MSIMKDRRVLIGLVVMCAVIASAIIWKVLTGKEVLLDQANRTYLVHGDVKIKKADSGSAWQKMDTSTVLEKGDSIETGQNSSADIVIGTDNDKLIKLGQKTKIEVEGVNPTRINMPEGKIIVSVKKIGHGSSFVVKTPTAICGARGTAWSEEADMAKTKISVFENDVFMNKIDINGRIKGRESIAKEGTERIILRDMPISAPGLISLEDAQDWLHWSKNIDYLRSGKVMVSDFDTKENFNNLDGAFGSWNTFYYDPNQSCKDELTDEVRFGDKGHSLKLTYDVDAPTSAYNGFFTKLEGIDISEYNYVVFHIKGDKDLGYTTKIKVELKNKSQIGKTTIDGITDEWKKYTLPLNQFVGINNFRNMQEFVIVFSDVDVTKKTGAIYVDDIYFTRNRD